MALPEDFRIDRKAAQRGFARRAPLAQGADFLAREVAQRMAARLHYIRHEPARILDAGCGQGQDFALLAQRYPKADLIGLDFALPALQHAERPRGWRAPLARWRGRTPHYLCADMAALPLRSGQIDMIWSNLALPWLHEPMPAFAEMQRVLSVGGMLMFATLGPDTLRELRSALPAHQGERVHRFIDMHDIGDCLVRAGFAEPVMDMERIGLSYADLDSLLRDLRMAGGANCAEGRPRGLTGQAGWASARSHYEQHRRDGRLPASFEIIYGHAWKAAPKQLADGRAVIQFHPRLP